LLWILLYEKRVIGMKSNMNNYPIYVSLMVCLDIQRCSVQLQQRKMTMASGLIVQGFVWLRTGRNQVLARREEEVLKAFKTLPVHIVIFRTRVGSRRLGLETFIRLAREEEARPRTIVEAK
jgi:hypothetical protein